MTTVFLFVFGLAIGSFLNVVSLRYNPEKFLFSKSLGGRSRCPKCGKTLHWFELIPLLSFFAQRGFCRSCGARLSVQYPIVEIISGFIFVLIPLRLHAFLPYLSSAGHYQLSALWIIVFELLLLMSIIDIRLSIIPDEINICLVILGICIAAIFSLGGSAISFLGQYAALFFLAENVWVAHILGFLFAFILFSLIIWVTRGRGMGLGDLKLAMPLGFIFGWPDIILVSTFGFVIGAVFGIYAIWFKNKNLKSAVPFGPFIALGAALTFFAGYELINWYFRIFII